jgi:hypothetical protein
MRRRNVEIRKCVKANQNNNIWRIMDQLS